VAMNQRANGSPNGSFLAVIEQPVEPGQPRLFWNPGASPPGWATPAANSAAWQVPLPVDPLVPGQILIQFPTSFTILWPNKIYMVAIIDANSAVKDDIIAQLSVNLMNGDDGGLGLPSSFLMPGQYQITSTLTVPAVAS
jgi:hypothetical protein